MLAGLISLVMLVLAGPAPCSLNDTSLPCLSRPIDAVQDSTFADYFRAGREKRLSSDPVAAIPLLEKAIEMARLENNTGNEISAFRELILAYWNDNRIELITQSGAVLYELAEKSGDLNSKYWAIVETGSANRVVNNLHDAIYWHEKGIQLAKENNNSHQLALNSLRLAQVYYRLRRFGEALELLEVARDIFTERGSIQFQIQTYFMLGLVHHHNSNLQTALEILFEGLELGAGLGDNATITDILNQISLIYEQQDEQVAALEYAIRALEIRRRIDRPLQLSNALYHIARLYFSAGQFEQAYIFNEECLEMERRYGRYEDILFTLTQGAAIYEVMGRYDKAIEYTSEAIELGHRHQIWRRINHPYRNQARVYIAMGEPEKAIAVLDEAFELIGRTGMEVQLDVLLLLQGNALNLTGRHDEALDYYRRALDLARSDASRPTPPPFYFHLARGFRYAGSDSAYYYAREFIERNNRYRANFRFSDALRAGVMRRFVEQYHEIARWYLDDLNDAGTAWHILEQAKARSFAESVAETGIDIMQDADQELVAHYEEARSRLEQAEAGVNRSASDHNESDLRLAQLLYENAAARLRNSNERYRMIYQPEPVTMDQVRRLIDRNTAVVTYAITRTHLLGVAFTTTRQHSWSIELDGIGGTSIDGGAGAGLAETGAGAGAGTEAGTGVHGGTTGTGTGNRSGSDSGTGTGSGDETGTGISESLPDQIGELVTQFRMAIESGASVRQIRRLGAGLSELLLDPARDLMSGKTNLIIIPDGSLAYLPFEALPWDNRYLISEFSVKYTPSMTVYSLLPEERSGSDRDRDILILANPEYGDLQEFATLTDAPLVRLPHTRIEADSVASNFSQVTRFQGPLATEAHFTAHELHRYRILHLATHGIVSENNPRMSGLVLAQASGQTGPMAWGNDAFLRVPEIQNLRLNADLVVLSACNTGLGRMIRGEGVLGLQRAFILAGSSAVMASLWPVQDRSTAVLMSRFYRELTRMEQERNTWRYRLAGWFTNEPDLYGSTSQALRNAKLELMMDPRFSHPRHWAGFVVLGR
jgi:CHAT domain-containing protein/tetratricopeptide (TPR) repeat protein